VHPAVHDCADERTFMRFLAPSAQPIRREQPFSSFSCSSLVTSSRLPCASTLYSLDELPGVFSTRCALGASPFRALPDRDRQRLSAGHPLMRLATDRSRTDIKPAFVLAPPQDWQSMTSSSNGPPKARPSWIYGARRFRRFRHCCQQRPRFRGFIPLPVGVHRRRISPRAASLALLGFILPGAFPFRALASTAVALGLTAASGNSAC